MSVSRKDASDTHRFEFLVGSGLEGSGICQNFPCEGVIPCHDGPPRKRQDKGIGVVEGFFGTQGKPRLLIGRHVVDTLKHSKGGDGGPGTLGVHLEQTQKGMIGVDKP